MSIDLCAIVMNCEIKFSRMEARYDINQGDDSAEYPETIENKVMEAFMPTSEHMLSQSGIAHCRAPLPSAAGDP